VLHGVTSSSQEPIEVVEYLWGANPHDDVTPGEVAAAFDRSAGHSRNELDNLLHAGRLELTGHSGRTYRKVTRYEAGN
jgi:predicted HTH transcriptional regulator